MKRAEEKPACVQCGKPVNPWARGRPYFCRQFCGYLFGEWIARQGWRRTGEQLKRSAIPDERHSPTIIDLKEGNTQ